MTYTRSNRPSKRQRRRMLFQAMESRRLLAGDVFNSSIMPENAVASAGEDVSAYHNSERPTDVNNDARTGALDALLVINHLIVHGSDQTLVGPNQSEIFPDVNNDGRVSPIDVLGVINELISQRQDTSPPAEDQPDDDDDAGDDVIDEDANMDSEDDPGEVEDDLDEIEDDPDDVDEDGSGVGNDEEEPFDEEGQPNEEDLYMIESELVGTEESEEIIGFESDDTLTGGGGSDVFWVTGGNDVITDFDPGEGDILYVRDFASGEDGITTLTSLEAIASLSEQTTFNGEPALVIDVDGDIGDWQTTLVGVSISDFSEDTVFFDLDESRLPIDVTHVPKTTVRLSDGTIAEFEDHSMEVHPLAFSLVSGEQASVDFLNESLGITVPEEDAVNDEDELDGDDQEPADDEKDCDDDESGDSDEMDDEAGDDDSEPDSDTDDGIDDDDSDDETTDGSGDGDDSSNDTGSDTGDDDSGGSDTGSDADGLNLLIDDSQLGTTEGFEIRTNGIFAVWWDPQAGPIEPGADAVFELLNEVRTDVQSNLGLGDPPNTAAGYYFNVFVHRGEDDRFPNFFGNGVGFEANTELPDLAMPVGLHDDRSNVLHEGFHVFQTSSNYEVVDTNPDAPWIVEASAEWYQAHRNPTDARSFIVAGSPYALPHLSWWYTPGREPEGVTEDNGWLYGVREYAISSFLYYLTNIESVDPAVIAGVYATNSDLTAQEYIYNQVGGDNLREMYADWAARTAAGLEYLSTEQVEVALNELNAQATPDEIKNNIVELNDAEANGSFSPSQELTPGGWAYNSIKINNTRDATYTIDIFGDANGSQGASSHFEARVAVVNGQSTTYHDVTMADNLTGQFVLNATSADSEIYLVIASTPDQLVGTQTYDYQVNISSSVAGGEMSSDAPPIVEDDDPEASEDSLKIYLLAGQSNAGGYGYTYESQGGIEENVTSIEFLLDDSPESATYRNNLRQAATHTVLPHLDASWMNTRDDVWAVAFDSSTGESQPIESTLEPSGSVYPSGIQPLGPGFGDDIFHAASFGPELGLGQQLGRSLDSPVLIAKSSHGGSSLAVDWRSPLAVAQRGGTMGTSYSNTVESIQQTLDTLDADLEDDGKLNAYSEATSYEIAGLIWLQGWNDHLEEGFVSEYSENLIDLVHSIRDADPRIANDLPAVIIESSDQDEVLNIAREQAVEELNRLNPGSAVFIETNDLIGQDWGSNRDGDPWNDTLDFHFDGKAENFLELGWVAGQTILDNGFTGNGPS
ncbi:MAG: dockerin type I domain-containing protein [Planctomycetota bacterium]